MNLLLIYLRVTLQRFTLFSIAFLYLFLLASAQPSNDQTLEVFIEEFYQTYERGTYEELNALFPQSAQKQLATYIQELKMPRRRGDAKILQQNQDSALVFLTVQVSTSQPYLNTLIPAGLSGFYQLENNQGGWYLTEKIPADRNNSIIRQSLDIDVLPGKRLKVSDTLTVDIADSLGFWMIVHNHANITSVIVNDTIADYFHKSGIFWVNATIAGQTRLFINYTIDAEHLRDDENPNFEKDSGILRYANWHPILGYNSSQDLADFLVNVRIPASYRLSTSFAQTDQIKDTIRTINAQSPYRTSDIALVYDNGWDVETYQYQDVTIEVFTTPDFKPSRDTLLAQTWGTYDLLASKFGPPRGGYLGVVQWRASPYSGWYARSNDIIISYKNGGAALKAKPLPGAKLAHELSHTWTNPTGPARLFLMEGWATYIEPYFLQKAHGDTTVELFWDKQRELYLKGNFDGNISLWNDATNSGVSYRKGSWVLKILEDLLGQDVLEKGLKGYIQNTISPKKDIHAFAESLSSAAGYDVWPILETWLKSPTIPEVKAYIEENQLVIEQLGDIFQFPLEVQIEAGQKTFISTYRVEEKNNKFPIQINSQDEVIITVDPNREALVRISDEK